MPNNLVLLCELNLEFENLILPCHLRFTCFRHSAYIAWIILTLGNPVKNLASASVLTYLSTWDFSRIFPVSIFNLLRSIRFLSLSLAKASVVLIKSALVSCNCENMFRTSIIKKKQNAFSVWTADDWWLPVFVSVSLQSSDIASTHVGLGEEVRRLLRLAGIRSNLWWPSSSSGQGWSWVGRPSTKCTEHTRECGRGSRYRWGFFGSARWSIRSHLSRFSLSRVLGNVKSL